MTLLNLARTWARTWAEQAQQHACRNAMIALTECTQRRAEREEVERYLAEQRDSRSAPRPASVPLHA